MADSKCRSRSERVSHTWSIMATWWLGTANTRWSVLRQEGSFPTFILAKVSRVASTVLGPCTCRRGTSKPLPPISALIPPVTRAGNGIFVLELVSEWSYYFGITFPFVWFSIVYLLVSEMQLVWMINSVFHKWVPFQDDNLFENTAYCITLYNTRSEEHIQSYQTMYQSFHWCHAKSSHRLWKLLRNSPVPN